MLFGDTFVVILTIEIPAHDGFNVQLWKDQSDDDECAKNIVREEGVVGIALPNLITRDVNEHHIVCLYLRHVPPLPGVGHSCRTRSPWPWT